MLLCNKSTVAQQQPKSIAVPFALSIRIAPAGQPMHPYDTPLPLNLVYLARATLNKRQASRSTADPVVHDDLTQGYSHRSLSQNSERFFLLDDSAPGPAVWIICP